MTEISVPNQASSPSRTRKGEQTRAAIFEAALVMFKERGYDATTMRGIAAAAGVSLGNSYHYFPSKEHLVVEFYRQSHLAHRAACEPTLARERDLTVRLRNVVRALIMTCEPYHAMAGSIFGTVADPASPLNPFSASSAEIRDRSIQLYVEVLNGSSARIPADLAAELPRLLWLYQMGIVYFWIFDQSAGRLGTLEVIDETADLIVRLVAVSNLPVLRRSRERIFALIRSIIEESQPPTPSALPASG